MTGHEWDPFLDDADNIAAVLAESARVLTDGDRWQEGLAYGLQLGRLDALQELRARIDQADAVACLALDELLAQAQTWPAGPVPHLDSRLNRKDTRWNLHAA